MWTGDGSNGNTTINAGLPNITGRMIFESLGDKMTGFTGTGAFSLTRTTGVANDSWDHSGNYGIKYDYSFSAQSSNSIYGNSLRLPEI